MIEVRMPRLADSMEEGTIVDWLKRAGETVAVGEPLVQIETDKATMDHEADQAGVLAEILAGPGDTVAVGEPICRLDASSLGDGQAAAPTPVTSNGRSDGDGAAGQDAPRVEVLASPVARRVAREHGVDLAAIAGTGPGGRVLRADVHEALRPARTRDTPPPSAAVSMPAPAAPADADRGAVRSIALSRAAVVAARRMAESKATIPHFCLEMDIDMAAAIDLRERLRPLAGDDRPLPSVNDLIVRACALALRGHERLNASYRDDHVDVYERVNVGIAVAADHALVVPTVFDADALALFAIAERTRTLADRVRRQTITPAELSGATFTVTNLGMLGIRSFQPVINPPQVAILAAGELRRRPQRTVMTVTLACDHRAVDGAAGARFLADVRALLEEPLRLAG